MRLEIDKRSEHLTFYIVIGLNLGCEACYHYAPADAPNIISREAPVTDGRFPGIFFK